MPNLSKPRVLLALLSGFLLPLSVACGDGGGSASGSAADIPTLAATEVFRIGSLDDPDDMLTSVGSVVIGRDETLYISQTADDWVLAFDSTGQRVRQIGRSGEGPGEFGRITSVGLFEDTLYVTDSGNGGAAFFKADGEFVRFDRWERQAPTPGDDGRLLFIQVPSVIRPDGTGVVAAGMVVMAPLGGGDPPGLRTLDYDAPLLLIDQSGAVLDTLIWETLESKSVRIAHPDGNYSIGCLLASIPPVPMADGSGAVFVVESIDDMGPRLEVMTMSVRGDTLVTRAYPFAPMAINDEILQDTIEGFVRRRTELERSVGTPGEVERALKRASCLPDFLPTVSRVTTTQDGRIWVRREVMPGAPVRWTVFDSDAVPVGELTLRPGERVMASRGQTLVTTVLDDFDVPYVIRYRIEEGG